MTGSRPSTYDALRALPEVLTGVIDGAWLPADAETPARELVDPGNAGVYARYAQSTPGEVDRAVRRAHEAQSAWAARSPHDRAAVLQSIARAIRENADVLAGLESVDTGKPLSQARGDIETAARYADFYAGAVDKFDGETLPQGAGTFAFTTREPYGVVGIITPWNAPVSQLMRGLAPCIAAGNGAVVKPASATPSTSALLAVLMAGAGLPAGLVNVVLGAGGAVGDALIGHELVRLVSFTGSTEIGRRVGRQAADRVIGAHLELGGKSPTIVCADADLARAARAGALAVVRNSGQSCFATTRLLVDRRVHDRFVALLRRELSGLTIGHGADDPHLGPLATAAQRDAVLSLIRGAEAEGARVESFGELPGTDGFFVRPTLVTGARNDMTIAREEVFGPVQTVIAFDTLDEAVELANDTPYGLSAGVFTRDIARAHRIARRLQAGQVQINRYAGAGVEIPFGGYKSSGLGREKGVEALRSYTQLKSTIVSLELPEEDEQNA